ncbi:MAG: hypothetical protein QGI15_04595 [Candidatus Scalindua sp.]|nr:hypothetical protein [Candidatus Scalindua sp.]
MVIIKKWGCFATEKIVHRTRHTTRRAGRRSPDKRRRGQERKTKI